MKKFAGILAGILTAAVILSGCGGQGGATQAETGAEATAAQTDAAAETTDAVAETTDAAAETTDAAAAEETGTAAESDVAYIQDKGTLIVGITDFAPMDYQENGEWVGFDADLAREVAAGLGVEIEFVEIDWDNKILELENRSIDVVWNGMTLRPEVLNAMECTNAYLNNAQVVVVAADVAADYQDLDSVKDLAFAVEAGSAGEEAAKENGFNYTSVTAQADALMEVASGTSDACIIDLLMAGAMIGEGTSYANLTYTVELTTEEYGIGCRKGSDLAAYINEELKAYEESGLLRETAERYGVQEALVPQN